MSEGIKPLPCLAPEGGSVPWRPFAEPRPPAPEEPGRTADTRSPISPPKPWTPGGEGDEERRREERGRGEREFMY